MWGLWKVLRNAYQMQQTELNFIKIDGNESIFKISTGFSTLKFDGHFTPLPVVVEGSYSA